MKHVTVLLDEAVTSLSLKKDSVVVDATFGSGGHAEAILNKLGKRGTYIGIDVDSSAFIGKRDVIEFYEAITHLVESNFRDLPKILDDLGLTKVDAILADLGWRIEQFRDAKKGFSFQNDTPLSMTYGNPSDYPFTAHDIVNEWEEANIADIIYGYGEERGSRRIAAAIVRARADKPIETSGELAAIVAEALPRPKGRTRIHPATKTFQALRIAVNDELGALETLIQEGFLRLTVGGRFAIITFHSIEDRLVKQLFNTFIQDHVAKKLTKKPIVATEEELDDNLRARSAKLRVITKIA